MKSAEEGVVGIHFLLLDEFLLQCSMSSYKFPSCLSRSGISLQLVKQSVISICQKKINAKMLIDYLIYYMSTE